MSESKPRARYTLEFKLEAVRLVKGGQVAAVTAKILGIPKQTLENWVRLANSKSVLTPCGHAVMQFVDSLSPR
jgi:transposase